MARISAIMALSCLKILVIDSLLRANHPLRSFSPPMRSIAMYVVSLR